MVAHTRYAFRASSIATTGKRFPAFVPSGATAWGIPARIILDEQDKTREEKAAKLGFSAYALTSKAEDDPLAKAVQGLLDHSVEMDKRIELILKQIEQLQSERDESQKQLRLGPKVVNK